MNKMKFNFDLGSLIYTNKSSYTVYFKSTMDSTSKRMTFLLYVADPDGSFSEPLKIKRSTFLTSKNCLNPLLDYFGEFTFEDIRNIYAKILENFAELQKTIVVTASKTSQTTVYETLCSYIRQKASDTSCKEILIENENGYIETKYFATVLSELNFDGYTRKDILYSLKTLGVLVCSNNRAYDYSKKIDGIAKHFYCLKLSTTTPKEDNQEAKLCA